MAAPPAPKPPTLLGYHRVLSPLAGVRVSPLCLGTMHFGGAWTRAMGECPKETAFRILDRFYEAGGNFIDTANFYQMEGSERWLGEWIAARDNRDELVLATKYTTSYRMTGPEKIKSNFQGNHSKSLRLSVEASLGKLNTDYVDLLYVHLWDFTTSVEEVMQALHHLVAAGKVLSIGISDAPAWLVVKCNEFERSLAKRDPDARFHGLTLFSVYQGRWSCSSRDFERDILPMCQSEGLALAPWGVLGRGQFKTPEEFQHEGTRNMGLQDDKNHVMHEKLAEVGRRKRTAPTNISLAYVLHKAPYVFPVIGCRTVEHFESSIQSLEVELTDDEVCEIEDAVPFDLGFPMSFLFETPRQKYRSSMSARHIWQVTCNTRLETVPGPRPIESKQGFNQLDRS